MARNYDLENEIAEGFYWDDQERFFTAMTNRGVPEEIQQRILARIVERWDTTDRCDYIITWLVEEGIIEVIAESIIIEMFSMMDPEIFTLEWFQNEMGIGFTYNPLTAVQELRIGG